MYSTVTDIITGSSALPGLFLGVLRMEAGTLQIYDLYQEG